MGANLCRIDKCAWVITRVDIHFILNWLLRSSRLPTGTSSLETVRKAARLAVYEAMMMNPNSHQVAATSRPEYKIVLDHLTALIHT